MLLKLMFLAFFVIFSVSGKLQNITVKGIAMCRGKPKPNAQILLMERDLLDYDDVLAETWSNVNGTFEIYGEEDEYGTIEPYIWIHHICFHQRTCLRTSEYKVPQDKIGRTYDMSYVSLNILTHNDKEYCEN